METLLQLNTSIFAETGASSRLADRFVAGWLESHPGARAIRRELATEPVPHLTAATFQAFGVAPEDRTPEQREAVALSDQLIAELRAADLIVLGLPMYNFAVPSTLKAYFDHVARAGVTFRYGPNGPEGLLTGKTAYVFATRGGSYAGTDADTETAYVRMFLGFLGIDDVTFAYAENLARNNSIADAEQAVEQLLTSATADAA